MNDSKDRRVTVVGAGNAGCAAAADLSLAGAEVTLYELPQFADNLRPVRERGSIKLSTIRRDGTGREGEAHLAKLTTDAEEAARGADVIIFATIALGQEAAARAFAPHLQTGQLVVLFTGYGGSILVRKIFSEAGAPEDVMVAETVTLPYICRLVAPAEVELRGKAYKSVPTAALPAADTDRAIDKLRPLYPMLAPADNVLETALLNTNVTRHTVGTLMNVGRIEYSGGDFFIYREAFTPAVWKVFDSLDGEKMALMRALGLKPRSFIDYRRMTIDLSLEEQKETGSKGPLSANTRYLTEDVPMGLVFFASLGELLGVPTPTANALIHLASVIGDTDYRGAGRTLQRLGLGSLTADQLRSFVAGAT